MGCISVVLTSPLGYVHVAADKVISLCSSDFCIFLNVQVGYSAHHPLMPCRDRLYKWSCGNVIAGEKKLQKITKNVHQGK